eukprot:s282_g3.t1
MWGCPFRPGDTVVKGHGPEIKKFLVFPIQALLPTFPTYQVAPAAMPDAAPDAMTLRVTILFCFCNHTWRSCQSKPTNIVPGMLRDSMTFRRVSSPHMDGAHDNGFTYRRQGKSRLGPRQPQGTMPTSENRTAVWEAGGVSSQWPAGMLQSWLENWKFEAVTLMSQPTEQRGKAHHEFFVFVKAPNQRPIKAAGKSMGHTNFWHTLNGSKGVSKPTDSKSVAPKTNSPMPPAETPTAESNEQQQEANADAKQPAPVGSSPDKKRPNVRPDATDNSETNFQGFEFADGGGTGDCSYRSLAVAYAIQDNKDVAEALQAGKPMGATLRAQVASHISRYNHFNEFFATDSHWTEALEDGPVPTMYDEWVQATARPNRWIDGIDCIDGCRFALVFPIVVAHFARFSTSNLTALKLLTQEMGLATQGDAGAGWLFTLAAHSLQLGIAAAMFADFEDIYSSPSAGEGDHAADDFGADLSEQDEPRFDFGDAVVDDDEDQSVQSIDPVPSSSTTSRRHRGSRGSGQKNKKWRSGHIPAPPAFAGDVEIDPFCLRHYARALRRWTTITKEYLPKNEQALRALDALTGDAALEFEEVDDSRYNQKDGIEILLKDLGVSFGEREVFRKGGLIREFESLVRVQGESVTAFVRRFRLMERKLQDAKIPQYPSETRAVKLLDGLRLDERATSQLLLAAGNRYDFQSLVDAIRVQYPPGLTLTGLARHPTLGTSLSSKSSKGSARGSFRSKVSTRSSTSSKWRAWHTHGETIEEGDGEDNQESYATAAEDAPEYDGNQEDEGFEYQYDEEDPDGAPQDAGDDQGAEGGEHQPDDEDHQALTATSKKLAANVQSRGYYTNVAKGKGKSVASGGKSKGKDKGQGKKSGVASPQSTSFKGKSKSVTKGKAGKGSSQMSSTQRQRLESSLCLGCGASDHWLRDCPNVTLHQAHVCSATTTLDGDGAVVWMVNSQDASASSAQAEAAQAPVRDAAAEDPIWVQHGMTWNEYRDAMMSHAESYPDSDAEGMNPDDYRDSVDACAVVFGVDFEQVARDTEQTRRELELQRPKEGEANQFHLSPCEGNQEQGEDLRTSRAHLKPQERNKICAAPQQEKGQEQGEDLRTSRTGRAAGSKQYGEETQGLQEPLRPSLGNISHLAEPAPLGSFCHVCGSSAMVSRHQCLKRSKSMPARLDSQSSTSATVLTATCDAGDADDRKGQCDGSPKLYRAPQLLMQYTQEPCLVIVDTGCQRQVAGRMWHNAHHSQIDLPRLTFSERCQFRFGPSTSSMSHERFAYPVGLGNHFAVMFFSCVDADAPALMSRQTLTTLDAIPDISAGKMHYRALQTTSPLYLSSCGHLAVRLDEWPSVMPSWPCNMSLHQDNLPDVWAPTASEVRAQELPGAKHPAVQPPGNVWPDTTAMAEELAVDPFEHAQPDPQCLQVGPLLRSHQHASQPEGPHFEQVHDPEYCDHDADHDGSHDGPDGHEQERVLQDFGQLQSPTRTASLRRSRPVSSHLRSVRLQSHSLSRATSSRQAQSQSSGQDTTGTAKGQRKGQGQGYGHLRYVIFWLGTLFAFISGLFLGTTSLAELQPAASVSSADGRTSSTSSARGLGSREAGESDGVRFSTELDLLDTRATGGGNLRPGGGIRLELGQPGGDERSDGGERWRSMMPQLQGSADAPLTFEDQQFTFMKPGRQKRLLGSVRSLRRIWMVEHSIYHNMVQSNRRLRRHKVDLVEIYGGHANITARALECGLRALQPIDKIHGISLTTREDHAWLRSQMRKWSPFLTLIEPECKLWSPLTNLNYYWRPGELQELRQVAQLTVEEVTDHIREIVQDGRYFLLENPHFGDFWKQPAMLKLMQELDLHYDFGHMCAYGLRGKHGGLMKKPTGWLSNHPVLLKSVTKKCDGRHDHEECMSGNSQLAAIYTRQLARSVIDSLMFVLQDLGDERFVLLATNYDDGFTNFPAGTSTAPRTPTSAPRTPARASSTPARAPSTPVRAPSTPAPSSYVDLQKDPDGWRPLLKEAVERLEGKVAVSAEIKPSAYLEQIKALVPWHLSYVQIYRTPKVRRLPAKKMLETPDITHRAAVLLYQDDTIAVESQDLSEVTNPAAKFDRTVRVAIFIYGKPMEVVTSAQRRAAATPKPIEVEPEEAMADWEPGAKDITFPGVSEDQLPTWMRSVLKRIHTNLGHPHNSTLVRQLAQANASPVALMGARALKCAVCDRLRPPRQQRPSKSMPVTRRFNERVMLDLVFVKDMSGETFTFLNQVDDATTYQILSLLPSREAQQVNKSLCLGWFRFFGLPEALLLDAEGAMKSFEFEELMAQSGIQVRFVPPDAHYQLGKGERHGDIAREIMHRLIHQHGILGADGMDMVATMATHAKNTLARRAGASPAQWVLGQNPRLPASLISETENPEAMHQLTLSRRMQMIEQVRYDAMRTFLDMDNDSALRQAMLRRSRPWRGAYEVGQKVVYWRLRNSLDNEGSQPGYRQGIILAADPGPTGSLWLRNDRGRVVQVAREQVRCLHGDEAWIPGEADFALLKHAEQDLDKKHAGQHDLRAPVPALPAPETPALELPAEPLPVTPGIPALQDVSQDQQRVVHDAPLDVSGTPLESEPNASAVLAPAQIPVPDDDFDMPEAAASRRSSAVSTLPEPDYKRLKTASSASSSRRSSLTPLLEGDEAAAPGHETPLQPVPEGEPIQTELPEANQSDAQVDNQRPDHASLLLYETYTMNSKAYCQYCGSLDKQIDSGKTQCSRCLCYEFTDHPEQVQNWFDEDAEYDARISRWRPSVLAHSEELHLPDQVELNKIWQTGAWNNNEVFRSKRMKKTKSTTRSPLMSTAVWSSALSSWIWSTLANVETEFPFEVPPEQQITIYHASRSFDVRQASHKIKKHRFLFGPHVPEQVLLLRHGRSDALRSGWDGTPMEFQSLCRTPSHFRAACHLVEWEEHLAEQQSVWMTSHGYVPASYEAFVNDSQNFQALPDTSDEEDAGLKRTQRQALKRELPWKSIDSADRPAFVEAIQKEWAEWCKWSSCEKFEGDVNTIPKELILPSRVCYRWKPLDGGSSFKAKARIVIQGFRDPHLPLLARDAPVLSRIGLMCILQWACSMNLDLWNGDCKSAFLQGKPDDERPRKIFMRVPQDGISLEAILEWYENPGQLYQLHAPVYGQANAPRQWYLHVLDVLTRLHWVRHSLDPCIFLFKNKSGTVIAVLGVHVDDIIACSSEAEVLKDVERSFSWGSTWEKNDFVFVGRRIVKQEDGRITISQSHYATDVIISKNKNDPEAKMGADRDAMSEFRSAIGSLQWMAGTTRPDLAADTSLLQKAHNDLTYGDLQEANAILKYAKATADSHITIRPIPLDSLILVAYGDSAFANAPGGKSQGGFLIAATTENAAHHETDASLLDWKSYRHQRVLRSTLASEAASLDKSEDYANFLGCMLGELTCPEYIASHSGKSPFAIWPVTDARSLFDAIHRLATSFAEKRVEIDIAALRQTCRNLRWVPTEAMLADGLTKRSRPLREHLRNWQGLCLHYHKAWRAGGRREESGESGALLLAEGHGLLSVFAPMFIWVERNFNATWNMIAFRAFLNFSMLQAWFPKEAEIWNQPTWFLSALTFSNLTMPTLVLPGLVPQGSRDLESAHLVPVGPDLFESHHAHFGLAQRGQPLQESRLNLGSYSSVLGSCHRNGLQKLLAALWGVSLLQKVSYSETARFHSSKEHPVDGKAPAIPVLAKHCQQRKAHESHRARIKQVKPATDMSAPSTMKMDHFRSNLKKERLLEDRYMEIDRQNRVLLKRMSEAMRKPNPYVVEKKEAAPPSLNRSGRKMEMVRITKDNARLLRSIQKGMSGHVRMPRGHRFCCSAMDPSSRALLRGPEDGPSLESSEGRLPVRHRWFLVMSGVIGICMAGLILSPRLVPSTFVHDVGSSFISV